VTSEESRRLSEEVEAMFREAFRPHAKPLAGLDRLIREIHAAGIPMAVASSAIRKNVEFTVDALGYGKYFRHLVSGDEVRQPKPDPEIYLKAAAKLGVEPADSVAFEDSFPGIEAAARAGMKCVAIGSTFPMAELRATRAHRVVRSFEELNVARLREIFKTG
jgi:beta-phosphoglucomutase